MSRKFLYTFLVLLLILNIALLVLVIKPAKGLEPKHTFLIEQLEFSADQIDKFKTMDKEHRVVMRGIDNDIRELKDKLFHSLNTSEDTVKKLAKSIGELETKKELELHRFFTSVREMCSPIQAKMFDRIISEALKGGPKGPPRHDKRPPHH